MSKLNMAVLGVSNIGGFCAKIMSEVHNINLIAVYDSNEELAKETANRYGCRYYTDVKELASDKDVEAVLLCVPDKYIRDNYKAVAESGKHILMEKPFAKTVSECIEIKELCEKNNIRLMVGQTSAFMPAAIITKERYKRGEIGDVIQFDIRHQMDKGVTELLKGSTSIMFYLGGHDTYLIPYITGLKITKVYAQSVQKEHKYGEDCIIVNFTLENGAIGVIECGWHLPVNCPVFIFNYVINGTKQTITADTNFSGFEVYGDQYENITLDYYELNGRSIGPHTDELIHFADCILNNREFIVNTDDAIDAVRVIEAVFESLKTDSPVKVVY